jgi:hypothetical protein
MNALQLSGPVGKDCPNRPQDVKAVRERLAEIEKISGGPWDGKFNDAILEGIHKVQRHFMKEPDRKIDVGGRTHHFLNAWTTKPVSPGVKFNDDLRKAWDWVDPLLPDGSFCSSAFRTPVEQRQILHGFFLNSYRNQIIAKYGERKYNRIKADLIGNEQQVLAMVRGVGQAIAAPGKSMHQLGKAVDIGGPTAIDKKQIEIVNLVARAHSDLLSGKVLRERNGCVHFEIR